MSTITLTFETQALDFSPLTRGQVEIKFDDGAVDHTLIERLTTGTAVTEYFKEVAWVGGQETTLNNQQAINFAASFNRDYSRVGGNGVTKNLIATVSGNIVTITATLGTFPTGSQYTGNVLVVGDFTRDNTAQTPPLVLSASATANGDCNVIEYSITASGGNGTYTLRNGSTVLESSWDGTASLNDLNRGTVNTLTITDGNGLTTSITVNVPRKLKIGEFKESFVQFETYSDVTITDVNPVNGLSPLEFALVDVGGDPTGEYQTSNAFPGVFPGQYDLYVKDKFGCSVSKVIEVRELEENGATEQTPVFYVPEGNALVFTDDVEYGGEVRKNYFNTTTRNENTIGVRHQVTQNFLADQEIPTRFMSSYPFHIATLWTCEGTKKDISVITTQTNLGVQEKIDCKLFQVTDGIGIYFDGGNEYQPDTTTVIGATTVENGSTPDWGQIGQLIFLDGIGAKYITGDGFDENRGYYLVVDGVTSDDVEAKVQTTYNKHPYNLFDFFLFMGYIPKEGYVRIEYGYSFDEIVGAVKSEVIKRIEDTQDWHLIKWGDQKNRGDMVYQSFPQPFIMLKGKLDNVYPDNSETSRGDSRTYSLDQESFLGFSFRTGNLSRQLVNKLQIASGTGYFSINGIPLVKTGNATIENMGTTNLKIWSCEFDYGGNQLGIKADENDILDVSTGTVGGGNTAKGGVPGLGDPLVYDGNTRYVDELGRFVTTPDGGFIGTV